VLFRRRVILYSTVIATLLVALALTAVGQRVGARFASHRDMYSRTTSERAAIEQDRRDTQRDLLVIGLVIAVVSAALSQLLVNAVVRPLTELSDTTRELEAGAPAPRQPLRAASDDIGMLRESIRKLANQRDAQRTALSIEEDLLVALTESLNEGVVAVDARQQVVRMNETARHLLRLREPVPFPADYLPRDRTLREALVAVLGGGNVVADEVRVDDRTLSLTARPLPAGGAVLALYDLTPFRRLEAVRRDFVANVSHELRTPLTIVSGFVETLQDDALPPDLRKRFLGMAESNVQRMQRIVDDLLDLSRIESGGWLPNPTEQDGAAVASEITAPLHDAARAKGVVLLNQIPPLCPLYADATALRQILSNLTENALRHTSRGEVVVFAEPETLGTWVGVRDTGEGISAEHLPRIFERFYRADPSRSREAGGTGLGLSIVKHLAEAHGGRMRAESVPEIGTSIAAFFPHATNAVS